MYKLYTNEGVRYVRASEVRLRAAMYAYIKRKREKGMSLASIVYCWVPIHTSSLP